MREWRWRTPAPKSVGMASGGVARCPDDYVLRWYLARLLLLRKTAPGVEKYKQPLTQRSVDFRSTQISDCFLISPARRRLVRRQREAPSDPLFHSSSLCAILPPHHHSPKQSPIPLARASSCPRTRSVSFKFAHQRPALSSTPSPFSTTLAGKTCANIVSSA